jgi:hypothetical protein
MKFTLDEKSQAEFRETLRKIADTNQRYIGNLLKTTAIYFAQSARKQTPKSKDKRPILVAKDRAQRYEWGNRKYAVPSWHRGMPVTRYVRNKRTAEKMAKITYQGAARAAWIGMIAKIRGSGSVGEIAAGKLIRVAAKGSTVYVDKPGKENRLINIIFHLGWLRRMKPNIITDSILKAEHRLINNEQPKWQAIMREAFGK